MANAGVHVSNLPDGTDQARTNSIFGAYGNIKSCQMQGPNSAIINFMSAEEASWVVDNLNGNIAQGLTTPVNLRFAMPQDACSGGGGGGAWQPTNWQGTAKGERHQPYGGGGGKDDHKGKGCGKWQPTFGTGKGGGGSWDSGGKDGRGKCSVSTLKKGLSYAGVLPGGKWSNDENALFVGGLPSDTSDLDMYEIFSCFGAIPTKGVRAMTHEDGKCKGFGFVNFLDQSSCQNAISILNGTMLPDGTTLKVVPKGEKGERSGERKGKGK